LHSIGDLANTGPFVVHHKANDVEDLVFLDNYKFLTRNEIAKIIYPNEMVGTFGDDKVKGSMLFSKKDRWFTESNHINQLKWKFKIRSLVNENEKYYNNIFDLENQKYEVRAPLSITSQPYIIAKGQQEE
jgi:hypothetical protein